MQFEPTITEKTEIGIRRLLGRLKPKRMHEVQLHDTLYVVHARNHTEAMGRALELHRANKPKGFRLGVLHIVLDN